MVKAEKFYLPQIKKTRNSLPNNVLDADWGFAGAQPQPGQHHVTDINCVFTKNLPLQNRMYLQLIWKICHLKKLQILDISQSFRIPLIISMYMTFL